MGMFDSGGGPEFSLGGMILGGRGYAANWFQQRDQMLWAAAAQMKQDALEKQAGLDMMADPRYKAFRDQPDNRAAALDFWAGSRGMPGDIDTQGASYVGTSLTAQYNRAQSILSAQQQKDTLAFSHTLNLQETDYRRQAELDLYKDKAEYDAKQKNLLADQLSALPGELAQNLAFKTRMGADALPDDMSVDFEPTTGELYFKPRTGSATHNKMMSQLTAAESINDKLTDMAEQMTSGDYTVEEWNASVAHLAMTAKSLFEAGSLDQGLLDVVNDMIPKVSHSGQVLENAITRSRKLETLRASIEMIKIRTRDVLDSYSYRRGDLPTERQADKYFPTPRGEPPEKGTVKNATKQIENQPAVPPVRGTSGGWNGPLGSGDMAPGWN